MPRKPKPTWRSHREWWSKCRECDLCQQRTRVVLARGTLPCDILFVGEAPGGSEDVLGKPFVGPAGKTLDGFLREALTYFDEPKFKWAFTNLVACIPLDDEGRKVHEPAKEHIESCGPRLQEFATLANASALVMVGKLAGKWCPKILQDFDFEYSIDIIHPAAILRMDPSQQSVAVQRTVVQLRDLLEEMQT